LSEESFNLSSGFFNLPAVLIILSAGLWELSESREFVISPESREFVISFENAGPKKFKKKITELKIIKNNKKKWNFICPTFRQLFGASGPEAGF
jgi:hypothetical protein